MLKKLDRFINKTLTRTSKEDTTPPPSDRAGLTIRQTRQTAKGLRGRGGLRRKKMTSK